MVTLDEAKLHCRVDHTHEDDIFATYISASSEWLAKIGIDVSINPIPAPVRQACLLIIGHFYNNREAVPEIRMDCILPLGVNTLIAPYREHGV